MHHKNHNRTRKAAEIFPPCRMNRNLLIYVFVPAFFVNFVDFLASKSEISYRDCPLVVNSEYPVSILPHVSRLLEYYFWQKELILDGYSLALAALN